MTIHSFFFRKQPVDGVALFRVVFSLMLIWNALLILPNLQEYFGPRGLVESSSPTQFGGLNLFYFFPVTRFTVGLVFGLGLLSNVTLLVGFWTRTSAFLAYLAMSSLHQCNHLVLHSGDTAMKLVLFLLMFSHAGGAWSVDRFLRVARGREVGPPRLQAPWAQRLIQIQIAFIYFSTSFLKLDGEAWANGNAVYYTSRLWDFERFPFPYVFDHLWSIRLMTWSSLALEGALGTLIWFRGFRNPLILVGIAFHIVIDYTMNIPVFEWIMISLLVGMLEPRDAYRVCRRVEGLLKKLRSRHADPRSPA